MGERKIVVPEGMLRAVRKRYPANRDNFSEAATRADLIDALRWLSENPIKPNDAQMQALWDDSASCGPFGTAKFAVIEWQRRMFLAPEPEVPEEIADMLLTRGCHKNVEGFKDELNLRILEAFNRGKKAATDAR